MRLHVVPMLLVAMPLAADVETLTLKQAIEVALRQSPDILMARLDRQKAELGIQVARDPFSPKVYVGSGLAYSNGFPMSIEGSAPSIVQARATASIYNRPQSFSVQQARENARAAGLDVDSKQEEVALRTASLYLDARKAARGSEIARKQIESLIKVLETVRTRVREGRELEIEAKRAELNVALMRQRAESFDLERHYLESALAAVLGLGVGDRVVTSDEPLPLSGLPDSEDACVRAALDNSRELKKLQSNLIAKGFESKMNKSTRYPKVDLVAQYGLFAKFNHYEDFFRTFQRNNGQLGVSFQLPVFAGKAAAAQGAQADLELAQLRIQMNQTRGRIGIETRRQYQALRVAETSREVSRLSLDVAREQVTLLLVQMEEGRASLRQLEEGRYAENERWTAFYEAQHNLERAKLDLLKSTGTLLTALK